MFLPAHFFLEKIFRLCRSRISTLVRRSLYLCLFVPLSRFAYRRYRRGSNDSFFANIPKRQQQRAMKIVGGVVLICAAVFEIVLASSEASDHRLVHFAVASVWLVLGADKWRRYLELKGPEISSSH
jgi:hypothetical protein